VPPHRGPGAAAVGLYRAGGHRQPPGQARSTHRLAGLRPATTSTTTTIIIIIIINITIIITTEGVI
jgi:hypothetical protein